MLFSVRRMIALFRAGRIDSNLLYNYFIRGRRRVLIVESTSVCNLKCSFCIIHECLGEKQHMALSTFKNVEKAFPEVGVVSLSGWGEAFLHKDIVYMIKAAKKHGCDVNITSNATMLTPGLSEELIHAGLDGLQISFDGATKETYESLRKGANYDNVLQNVMTLNKLKKQYKSKKPHLQLQYVATTTNYKEMPMFVDLAEKMEINFITFKTIDNITKKEDEELTLISSKKDDLPVDDIRKSVAATLELARRKKIYVSLFGELPAILDSRLEINPLSCDPSGVSFISDIGEVSPCCSLGHSLPRIFFGKEMIQPNLVFGNINEESFDAIWNKQDYIDFRKDFKNRTPPRECKTCYLLYGF